jgi:hypothetical protein
MATTRLRALPVGPANHVPRAVHDELRGTRSPEKMITQSRPVPIPEGVGTGPEPCLFLRDPRQSNVPSFVRRESVSNSIRVAADKGHRPQGLKIKIDLQRPLFDGETGPSLGFVGRTPDAHRHPSGHRSRPGSRCPAKNRTRVSAAVRGSSAVSWPPLPNSHVPFGPHRVVPRSLGST